MISMVGSLKEDSSVSGQVACRSFPFILLCQRCQKFIIDDWIKMVWGMCDRGTIQLSLRGPIWSFSLISGLAVPPRFIVILAIGLLRGLLGSDRKSRTSCRP